MPKVTFVAFGRDRDSHPKKRGNVVKFRSIVGRIVALCWTLFFIKFNEL